jgi:cytochrome b561
LHPGDVLHRRRHGLDRGAGLRDLLSTHKTLGIAILLLAVIRLGVRLRYGAPALPADLPEPMRLAAHLSHYVLYALMIAMPLIGWAMMSAAAYPIVLYGGLRLPPILPASTGLHTLLWGAHYYLAFTFFALVLLHIAAALLHLLIRRDGVFQSHGAGADPRRGRLGEVRPGRPGKQARLSTFSTRGGEWRSRPGCSAACRLRSARPPRLSWPPPWGGDHLGQKLTAAPVQRQRLAPPRRPVGSSNRQETRPSRVAIGGWGGMRSYDYIVVGAGSAGAVVANRLSADINNTVLLLEAGRASHPWSRIPIGYAKLVIRNPAVNWLYSGEPEASTGGRRLPVPRGRMLGGSSSINGLAFVRGQAQDFDSWAQMGNAGWSYADVLPFFKRMERYEGGGDDAFRGRDGPLRVTDPPPRDPLYAALIRAAGEVGIAHNPDYNGARQDGIAMSQATIASRRRMSTAYCYLEPIRSARTLHIETGALTESLLFDGSRCTGVRYTVADTPHTKHWLGARSSSAAARSTRRNCWSFPASASRNGCAHSASRRATRSPASARTCATIMRRARAGRSVQRAGPSTIVDAASG